MSDIFILKKNVWGTNCILKSKLLYIRLNIVKGDGKSLAIATASIVAKVTRDRILCKIAKEFPEYEFEKHKGYGTKKHREILVEKGACRYHRKTFLKKILGGSEKKK